MKNLDTGLEPIGFLPYDEALRNFFTIKVYSDPGDKEVFETLIPVMGPPKIEYSTQEFLSPIGEHPGARDNLTIHLPALAITQLNWQFDLTRWTRAHFRRLGWTEEGSKVIQSQQLVPVDVTYQLDIWTKYRATMNQIIRTMLLKFVNREIWLPVDLKGVWGVHSIPLSMLYNGPRNLTDPEPVNKDRTVKMAIVFTLRAWILPDATMLPAIRSTLYEIYHSDKTGAAYPSFGALPPYPSWVFDKSVKVVEKPPVDPSPNP